MRHATLSLSTIGWGAAFGLWLISASASAQTSDGAFANLSPGEQKIARALFDAQTRSTAPGAPRLLSLDQIAAEKRGHDGWGEVFKDMKTRGLLTEKNLGQVVSRSEQQQREARGPVTGRDRDEASKGIVSGTGNSGRGNDQGISTGTGRGVGSGGGTDGVRGGGGVGHGGGGRR